MLLPHRWMIALLAICLSCTSDGNEPTIPLSPVYVDLNLQIDAYRSLLNPTTMQAITEAPVAQTALGYAGILVVHGLSSGVYYAYDLACPVEQSRVVRIAPEAFNVRCPRCQTVYDVLTGSGAVLRGAGRSPLRRYHAIWHPERMVLTIRN